MAHLPTFPADYPGAIVVPAAKYGYSGAINWPRAWGLHTPEEPPDDQPSTPYYFHNLTDRNASTTYFVSYLGFVFQMVPEDEGAYANNVVGKPYPVWANPTITLNLQTINVEIEGYAATIHQTMPRGSSQWNALVNLMAHRCVELGIPPERSFGHYEVSNQRSDPGQLDIPLLVSDVITKMEPPPEPEPEPELEPELPREEDNVIIVIIKGKTKTEQYVLNPDGRKYKLLSTEHLVALKRLADTGAIRLERRELSDADVAAIPDEHA